jgi:hypothetical protein
MYKSDAEGLIRRVMEETKAQFSEEQIEALSIITTRVAAAVVEEALSQWRPASGSRPNYTAG